MFASLASGVQALGIRFTVSALLPFTIITASFFAIGAMVAAGPAIPPEEAVSRAAQALGWSGLAIGIVAAFILAVITQPFQIVVVRVLEGYWRGGSTVARARELGVEIQRRKQHRLRLALRRAERASQLDEAAMLRVRLARFPAPKELLATSLGNALRSGERIAGERYGLDTVRTWSRLYYVLPETFRRDVAELHGHVDGSARLSLALFTSGLASVPVLAHHEWWNLAWMTLIALGVMAYRGGIAAAASLTEVLCAAFDLHRFELIEAVHFPLPSTHARELEQAGTMQALWSRTPGDPPVDVTFAHSSTNAVTMEEPHPTTG